MFFLQLSSYNKLCKVSDRRKRETNDTINANDMLARNTLLRIMNLTTTKQTIRHVSTNYRHVIEYIHDCRHNTM